MTTFTATRSGPVLLVLDLDHGGITVTVEDRETAEITLSSLRADDETARQLIERATAEQRGHTWTVTVPSPPETAHQHVTTTSSGGVVVSQVASVVTGVMIGVQIDSRGRITSPGSAGGPVLTGSGRIWAEVRLPRGSSVQVGTISANLSVDGAVEELGFRSTSGRLSAAAVADLDVDTSSGDVTVWQVATARVSTMSGNVRLVSTKRATAKTMSGNVRLALHGGTGRVRTMSGNVDVHAVETSTVDVNTMSGDIELGAAPDASLHESVRTMSGQVTWNS